MDEIDGLAYYLHRANCEIDCLKRQLAQARKRAFLDAAKLADKYATDYWKDGARNIAEALRREAEKP